ncbi:MAG: hypothetical protein DRP00_04160 [Candidatus Aenigmatarchaeota archaeon]|nr:MAG: hypothetical protein DRP00_04160 [Candidatus Aenigmarchaeota archaeon]
MSGDAKGFVRLGTDPLAVLSRTRFTVLWSGGKDSTAALLWVLDNVRHEDWNVLYIEVTGNTHPLCTRYVLETAKALGIRNKLIVARRDDLDFFEALKRYGIPIIHRNRWCLTLFKLPPILRYAHYVHVVGVRARESIFRRTNYAHVTYSVVENRLIVAPILYWTYKDVTEYLRRWSVDPNPCYALYGHSGNCMFCPNHSKEKAFKTLLDPEWRSKIVDALKAQRGKHRVVKMWLALAERIEKTRSLTSYATERVRMR